MKGRPLFWYAFLLEGGGGWGGGVVDDDSAGRHRIDCRRLNQGLRAHIAKGKWAVLSGDIIALRR